MSTSEQVLSPIQIYHFSGSVDEIGDRGEDILKSTLRMQWFNDEPVQVIVKLLFISQCFIILLKVNFLLESVNGNICGDFGFTVSKADAILGNICHTKYIFSAKLRY